MRSTRLLRQGSDFAFLKCKAEDHNYSRFSLSSPRQTSSQFLIHQSSTQPVFILVVMNSLWASTVLFVKKTLYKNQGTAREYLICTKLTTVDKYIKQPWEVSPFTPQFVSTLVYGHWSLALFECPANSCHLSRAVSSAQQFWKLLELYLVLSGLAVFMWGKKGQVSSPTKSGPTGWSRWSIHRRNKRWWSPNRQCPN